MTQTDGAGDPTNYAYDPLDRTLIVTDPVGRRVATVYDLAGQTLATWKGWNSTTAPTAGTAWTPSSYQGSGPIRYAAYTYGEDGEVLTVADSNNNLSTSRYDGFLRLSQLRFPSPTLGAMASSTTDYEAYTYDANGNRLTERRRDGQVVAYQYDALNRRTAKLVPDGSGGNSVYYCYDRANRPTRENYGSAADCQNTSTAGITYGYDTAKRLISEKQNGLTMVFGYDPAGNRSQLTWPDGQYVNYDSDALDRNYQIRLDGASSGAGVLGVYTYDALSRVQNLARGNGASTGYGYDLASRLTSMSHAGTSSSLTLGFGYTLAGQLHTRTSSKAVYDFAPGIGSTAYTPNGLNAYTSVAGTSYQYDGRGNLTSTGAVSYTYDIENRLLTASAPTAVTLSYDPHGRLQQTSASSGTTQFLYAGADLVAEYNGSGTLLRRYVQGPGTDRPLVWFEGSDFGTPSYLHDDERGSIIATSSSSGAATVYTYGPYGEPNSWTGSRFRYTGQTAIPEAQITTRRG